MRAAVFVLSCLSVLPLFGQESREESAFPNIKLSRAGHADVNAKQRSFSWEIGEGDEKALTVRVVFVEAGSIRPTELFRSEDRKGTVNLERFRRGPGLYALLVAERDQPNERALTGLRLAYTTFRADCPGKDPWWPAQERTGETQHPPAAPVTTNLSNLLELSRRARYVVTAVVDGFQTCPSREGHIFTYVSFRNVETLEKEGATPAPATLLLRVPGGMVDGIVEVVTDAPIFRRGDRVLLFLTRDPQQQVPIVHSASGVFLLSPRGDVSVLEGRAITAVDTAFDLALDPLYKPDTKDARHWDPNMTAVWREPPTTPSIGDPPSRPEPRRPMSFEQFRASIRDAWRQADRAGRLPKTLDYSPRRPYGATPPAQARKGEKQ